MVLTELYFTFSKDERVHFTEHVKWVAKQYPPAKYNNTNMKLVKPRIQARGFSKAEMSSPKPTSSW